jgi:hypothetical protein
MCDFPVLDLPVRLFELVIRLAEPVAFGFDSGESARGGQI